MPTDFTSKKCIVAGYDNVLFMIVRLLKANHDMGSSFSLYPPFFGQSKSPSERRGPIREDEMTIEWYIKNVLVKDLGKMVFTPGLQYLSFGVMGSMIEFLGAFFDNEDFHKQGISRDRFSKAIQSLGAFTEYRKFDDPKSPNDLYSNMRCGMAHIGKPNVGVAFTERGNPKEWDKHLQVCTVNDQNHPQRLILVCEDLYFDITNGANELLNRIKAKDGSIKRNSSDSFLNPSLEII